MLKNPDLSSAAFIAPTAIVIGNVMIAEEVSIWYHAVIRADLNTIYLGKCTNVQDGAVLHGDPGQDLLIEPYVTIGHRAIVHGTYVGQGSLVGMGAIVLEGIRIGAGSIVGAGAVVTKEVPPGVVVAGVPAKVIREVPQEEQEKLKHHAEFYYQLALQHRQD